MMAKRATADQQQIMEISNNKNRIINKKQRKRVAIAFDRG
jgi:hypothetical protein